MGYTKDLWTKPQKQPDGKIKRVPNDRWGKGKRWLACWQTPDGNERTKAFRGKTPANNYWRDMESARDHGDYYDPKVGEALIDSIAQKWLSLRQVDPSTKIVDESIYRLHIAPQFGRRKVKSIKPSSVATFQAELGTRRGSSVVASARRVLLGILDLAVADELIKKNPALSKIVPRIPGDTGEQLHAWGDEQVFGLIDGHPESLRILPTIGATCGLRQGELFGVAEEDIDYDEGVIHVRRQIKKLGKDYVFALPKNDRERLVPLSSWTADGVIAHMIKYPPKALSLPWENPEGPIRTHKVLFRWLDGSHLKPRAYSETVWKPALAAASIIPKPIKDERGRKRYLTTRKEGTHQLRHYYASIMLADGVNIKELAEYMGHADPSFTLKVYAHMLPDSHDRARRAIDNRMFRPRIVRDAVRVESDGT